MCALCTASLVVLSNANAAEYTCTTKVYVECNTGYYLSDCGTTYNGQTIESPSAGNSCNSCTSLGDNYECAGGIKCPELKGVYVTYNVNGGSGSLQKQICTIDASCTLHDGSKDFYRAGYVFKGWSTSSTSTKKSSPIAIVILVVAVIILIVFGINKLGIFSKDKDQGGAEGGNDTGKTGTLLENITINSYTCMNEECTYNINGMDENSIFYFKGNNKELFDELNDYKDDIKVNIYYKEEKGKKNITSYEIYTKESNENISSVKDLNELREKLGLYALGTQTDELTLKEIGTPGLGSSDDKSYAYVDYKFENNSGKIFKMKYIFNDGESQDDINLEIDKKYNVTFEVVEGFIHIEYNIKSINQ